MNITRETIKSTLRTIMAEESEYQTFFKKALEKAGKSIPSMSDEEKKAFFNKIDAAWDAKGERKNEGNAFGAAVTAAKKAGEDEFEVGGKTYKVEETNDCGCNSVNEGFYKSIMNDGGRNLFFAMVNDKTDDVKVIDAKTWLSSSLMDNASDVSKDRVVKAILRNEKQFNKKVEYNMWAKKNNPSFEQKMDYFFKNGFISNITKKGIRVYESVESVNEGRAFINAAKKAKAEGKTEFEFNGKTYPVTIKEQTINERRLGKVDLLKTVENGDSSYVEGVKISPELAFELRMFLQRPLMARTRTGIAIDNAQMKDALGMLAKVGVHKRLSSGVKGEFANLLKKYTK